MAPATDDVIAALAALREEVERCSNCILAETRTKAVFGEGDAGAELMFVGEAPGYHEDQQGRPFVGQAGKLLEQLLASIGLTREQVYIANVLKSRPPNNRDPQVEEIDACRPYLWRQIEIIRPKVICTLGNFATKLLTGEQSGITKVHGRPRATEIAGHRLYLYPIFHPAAALYTPANLATLKEDFLRLPQLLAQAAPQPGDEAAAPPAAERPAWQPPEHLRRQAQGQAADTPTPALADAAAVTPTLDAAAVTPTLDDVAAVLVPTPEDAPVVAPRQAMAAADPAPVPEADPAPETSPAPAAEDAPAAASPAEDAPAAAPPAPVTEAIPAQAPAAPAPAPETPTGPAADPEQLGLF